MTTENLKLDREIILATKRQYLEARQEKTPIQAVIALATMQRRPRSILNTVSGSNRIQLIGQIRRSDTYDPVATALQYTRAGVDAISFFTDHAIYADDLDDVLMVASGIKKTPIIYQNYILNDYHVVEARAADASALVLNASVLERDVLRRAVSVTQRWKMSAVVQVTNQQQLDYANELSPHAIGIGKSDWEESKMALALLQRLRPLVTYNVRVLPMHCFQTLDGVKAALDAGVDAIIVDHHLLGQPHKAEKLQQLLE